MTMKELGRLRPLLVLGLTLPSLACSRALPAGASAVPHDPTPQMKCSVAVSKSEPLVTEWPASQKSRLESLLARGGIAVSYSGCEMHVLDACPVKGSYAFTRTTLATDTVEITDEDDLYTKLPLGAVRLSGDLQRSGRLAVRTTVVGQFALTGAGPADVPSDGECASATHLVTGLSIGAFKLLAGGKVKASVGGHVGPVGEVGGGAGHEETTLTEAGDPKACAEPGDTPNANCKSPLQVFLRPLHRASFVNGTQTLVHTEMPEEKAPPEAVRVNFKAASSSEHWSLLANDGKLVCDLPCSRWVGPSSGMSVRLDADRKEDVMSVLLPAKFEYSAGRTADGVVRGPRGSGTIAVELIVFGVISTAVAVGFLDGAFQQTCGGQFGDHCSPNSSQAEQGAAALAFWIGGGLLVAGGITLARYTRQSPSLDLTLASRTTASGAPLFVARPGFLGLAASSGERVGLTPGGLGGAF